MIASVLEATAPRGGSKHLAALDGLRGIAAVAVAIRHTMNAIPMPGELRRSLFESPLALVLTAQGAVQVFFVLSGWVLAASLARGPGTPRAWLPFYVRRVFRIHPPYVFAVLVAWAVSAAPPIAPDSGVTAWVARFANADPSTPAVLRSLAFPSIGAGLLPVGWTLTIEMIYSFAMPLLWLTAGFARGLALLAVATLLLFLPWQIGWFGIDFALGVVAFRERDTIARALGRLPHAVRSLVPVAGALLLAAPLAFFPKHERFGVLVEAKGPAEIGVMGLGAVLLVIAAVTLPGFARAVGARAFERLGRISYSIYLLHHTLLALAAPLVLVGGSPLWEGLGLIAIVTGGSILLAVPAHRFVELPAIALGQRLARSLERRLGSTRAVVAP